MTCDEVSTEIKGGKQYQVFFFVFFYFKKAYFLKLFYV